MAQLLNDEELNEVSGGGWFSRSDFSHYTVKENDTPSGIAYRFGITLQKLLELNSDIIKNANEIKKDIKLRVPNKLF